MRGGEAHLLLTALVDIESESINLNLAVSFGDLNSAIVFRNLRENLQNEIKHAIHLVLLLEKKNTTEQICNNNQVMTIPKCEDQPPGV